MSDIAAKVVTALNWSRDILMVSSKFMVLSSASRPQFMVYELRDL